LIDAGHSEWLEPVRWERAVIAQFFDMQEKANPLSGTRVRNSTELVRLLDRLHDRKPFFAELVGENGFKMLLGIGVPEACVQFSPTDGSTPYLMAVVRDAPNADEGEIEFLIGNTVTSVPKRFALPYETMVEIAARFVDSGERYSGVAWEST